MERYSQETLFRKEATASLHVRNYGRPIARMPRVWLFTSLSIFTMVIIAVWYLVSSHYARKEIVRGWLVPEKGLINIVSDRNSVVASVDAIEGQRVTKGQPILSLTFDISELNDISATDKRREEIARQKDELHKRLSILERSFHIDKKKLTHQIDTYRSQQENFEKQIAAQARRLDIEKSQVKSLSTLSLEGAVTVFESERQEGRLVEQEQILYQLIQNHDTLINDSKSLSIELNRLPLEYGKQRSLLISEISVLTEREMDIVSRNKLVISSPIEGFLVWVQAKQGNSIRPDTTLFSVIPLDTKLYAELFIPSNAIGFVEQGKAVRVMLDAFPHQSFGSLKGVVSQVGRVALSPDEFPRQIQLEAAAYRSRVMLEQQHIDAFGKAHLLKPGMALTGEIILEKRSFLSWLLEPIFARQKEQQFINEVGL